MAVSDIASQTDKIKQLEKKIKKLEANEKNIKLKAQFFDEHLEHLPSVYYRFDINNNEYDYVSPKIFDLTGYTVEEFKGKTIQDANSETHPDDIEQLLQQIQNLHLSGEKRCSTKLVYRRRIKNGTYVWVQDNLTLLKDNNNQPICYIGNATDITKQKSDELKHKEDKKLNQFILDSNPNLIYVKNAQGKYLMANKALANFFEIQQDQLIHRLNSDFFTNTEYIDFYDKSERKVLETGKPVTYEEKFTTPSGKVYYLQTTKTPLTVPGESPLILVNSTNITDKKIAENNLKLSEALYKNLIDSLNFPFIMLDMYGSLKIMNKCAVNWFHLQNKKWFGLKWNKIQDFKIILNSTDIEISDIKKPLDFEVNIEKNKKSIWMWCNIQPVYDHHHQKIGTQVIIFDITSRKNTIEKLSQNEITFRGIINASSDLIFLVDKQSRLITANQAAQDFVGLPLDKMENKNAVELFGEEEGKRRQNLANRVFKTKVYQQTEEQLGNRSIAIYMYPIFNYKNEVHQIAVMVRDITPLKRAETEVRKSLEREKELNQLRSGVISTVSHEFRTPLAVILSNIQVVQKYHRQLTPEQFDSKFQLIYGSINQLDYMLDNISLLDKNARGLLRYNPSTILLEDQLNQIVQELNSIVGNTERIQTVFHDTFGYVLMDIMLLRHILANLLSNALKFSDATRPVIFQVKKLQHHKMQFDIADQGRGIKKDELENIWEPFFRGSNSEGIKGTGIGISIVKTCTDLCGGKIKIKSTFKKGTNVSVILPYKKAI